MYLTITLKAKGPGSVYSSQLESKDPKVTATRNDSYCQINKNQEVKVEATAILGKGKTHMKFSPGLMYYQGYPTITIEKKTGVKKCIEACNDNLTEKGDQLIIKDFKNGMTHVKKYANKTV